MARKVTGMDPRRCLAPGTPLLLASARVKSRQEPVLRLFSQGRRRAGFGLQVSETPLDTSFSHLDQRLVINSFVPGQCHAVGIRTCPEGAGRHRLLP